MSHKKYLSLGLLPVLGLMMMSPATVRNMKMNRGIAADESNQLDINAQRQRIHELARAGELPLAPVEPATPVAANAPAANAPVVSAHPRFNVISERFQKEHPHVANNDLDRTIYIRNLEGFVSLIDSEKDSITAELSDLAKVREAQNRITGEAEAISQSEKDLADLEARNLIKSDDEKKPRDLISSAKTKLEDLLNRLETAKVALENAPARPAAAVAVKDTHEQAHAQPATPTVAAAAEEKKEEVREEDSSRRSSRSRRERNAEKSELEEILCELRDSNKAMNESMQKLLSDQQNIMQQMMTMMQSMVSMNEYRDQQQRSQNLYQYNPQFPQGNWMFMPNGFQPSTSVFGQQVPNLYTPQLFGQTPTFNAGVQSGNESAVSSGSWSLRPDQGLQLMDPRLVPMQNLAPGQFGSAPSALGSFGVDMSQGSALPMPFLTQPQGQPQPQQPSIQGVQPQQFRPQQIPFNLPSTSPQFGGPITFA